MAKKPQPQIKVKRMNINLPVELHDAFKATTAAQSKNMTDVLIEFIDQYIRKNMPKALTNRKGLQ
jgi:hypothetical protein